MRNLVVAIVALLVGCAAAPVTVSTPTSMQKVSNIVEVRVEGERQHEKLAASLKSLVEDRLRKRGFEIGGSLDNWRLDVDLLEIDTTKLQNQRRLVVELRVRAIGARGEEYFKHNYTEVTPQVAPPNGTVIEAHLPSLAEAIVAHVP